MKLMALTKWSEFDLEAARWDNVCRPALQSPHLGGH